ncbi:MAG: hypothetical protein WCO35_01665 [Candidatus Nomurabacteria bacterium]
MTQEVITPVTTILLEIVSAIGLVIVMIIPFILFKNREDEHVIKNYNKNIKF